MIREINHEHMNKRSVGRTELSVNEIGYGAMHLSIDRDRRPAESASVALIQRAVDELGIDFIDTADAYCADHTDTGHNERLISEALRGERRQRVVVATKGGSVRPDGRWTRNGRPEHLRRACEASLRALETDRIDLYQLHAIDPTVPVEESVGALADLQREGKIRFIGVSNFGLRDLERTVRETEIVSVQNQFSVINHDDEDDAVIAFCEANGLTFIPWNPVGGRGTAPKLGEASAVLDEIATRHDTTPHVVALAWLLQRSPTMIPIPGTRSFEHLAEDLRAADLKLSDEDIAQLG
jgi:aryl-alcohol dehydrogenase-like predicted oxidoreductase